MGKLKSYLAATGCFVILVGVLTLMSPTVLQGDEGDDDGPNNVNVVNTTANPIPVVVQNGDANGTAVVPLAEDLPFGGSENIEFAPVNLDTFRFVSFLGNGSVNTNMEIDFVFSTESALVSSSVPRLAGGRCVLRPEGVRECRIIPGGTQPAVEAFRVAGRFLAVRITNGKVSRFTGANSMFSLPPNNVNVVNTTANPIPVVVQNGDANGTAVVPLAEDLPFGGSENIEFAPVNLDTFRFVSFLGNGSVNTNMEIDFVFSTESALVSSSVPRLAGGRCVLRPEGVRECRIIPGGTQPAVEAFRVAGRFLAVRITNGSTPATVTLKVFLSR